MQPFLAMITPLSGGGGPVDPGYGVPGWPSHPIAPGGRPPGTWGGVPPNYIDIGLPGQPPGIWGGSPAWPSHPIAPGGQPPHPDQGLPGYPSHPIAPGGRPPGIWGGAPPWIDNTLPGPQPVPGWPPVVMPPIAPGGKPPEPGNGLSPSNPIYIPGESGPGGVKHLVWVFVPGVGGVWFLVDVPTSGGPHPSHPIVEQPPQGGPKRA
jgi:hypothetical protein